jgi:trk system potassium uptake protein TrkH
MNRIRFLDLRIVSYYIGYIILVIGLAMLIPIAFSIVFLEWNVVLDFAISLSISVLVGLSMIGFGQITRQEHTPLQWKHGFIIVSLSWILLMMISAIPFSLSGHMGSFLDACFDVMSGFTTTGLFLLQDLDHVSVGLNAWRHLITFIGGQGMVVLAISLLIPEMAGAFKFYFGEGKDVTLVPNIRGTTRFIWLISLVYLAIGTVALWIAGISIGFAPGSAFLHALFMSESAWSTGGFAPNFQNIMYYHSLGYEIITIVIMILGSFNFALHYAVIKGRPKEFVKNIETQSFLTTCFIACALAALWLFRSGIYTEALAVFRRVVYNVISAHTTTGFSNVYARQFLHEWGGFGVLILIIAMLIGGSSASTAGGFKGLRVGIVFRGLVADIKKLFKTENKVQVIKYHHIKDQTLDDSVFRSAAGIILLYIVTFTIGTLLAVWYGYSLAEAAFESASVTGNVGLSIGITQAGMPTGLKIWYITAMYLGRLEFLSVFALIGVIFQGVKSWLKKISKRH